MPVASATAAPPDEPAADRGRIDRADLDPVRVSVDPPLTTGLHVGGDLLRIGAGVIDRQLPGLDDRAPAVEVRGDQPRGSLAGERFLHSLGESQ